MKWLPSRLTQDEANVSSDFMAAHHSSITWYLSRRLAEASQAQKEMQEERVRRQLERTRTLGSGAARDAMRIGLGESLTLVKQEIEDDEIELSQSQILQFETENANILRSVQDMLESVHLAESRLLDISALQMELVTHLTRQTELTNQLYEDAISTTTTMEKANVQLRDTKRRSNDSRIFVLVFLVGASLSLLFLHYY